MAIVQFPMERLGHAERSALRHGVARSTRTTPSLRLVQVGQAVPAYCAACAAPIDGGPVWRGEEAFCSFECSLGSNRPA